MAINEKWLVLGRGAGVLRKCGTECSSYRATPPEHRLKRNWSHFRRPTGLSCEGGEAGEEEKEFGGGLGYIQGQPRWATWSYGWSVWRKTLKVCNIQNTAFLLQNRKSSSGDVNSPDVNRLDGDTVNFVTGEDGQRRTGRTNRQETTRA